MEAENSYLDNREFFTLRSGIIYDILQESNLSIEDKNLNELHNFLQRDSSKGVAEWIENFPLDFLIEGGEIVNKLNLFDQGKLF